MDSLLAFNYQAALIDFWRSPRCFNLAHAMIRPFADLSNARTREDVMGLMDRFNTGSCYFITPEIMDVLLTALPSMPNVPLSAVNVPRDGFVVFGTRVVVRSSSPYSDHVVEALDGVSWYRLPDGATRVLFWSNEVGPDPIPFIPVLMFRWNDEELVEEPGPQLSAYDDDFYRSFHVAQEDRVKFDDETKQATILARRFLISFFGFIDQTIATIENEKPPRGLRRRSVLPESNQFVKIIHLRKSVQSGQAVQRSVDWQHRWIVKGHWRNQYYRGSSQHKLIFISPYVKGPDGKPLLSPRIPVFNVGR